jgi:hypothetical protein
MEGTTFQSPETFLFNTLYIFEIWIQMGPLMDEG